MAINSQALIDALASHALSIGHFDQVNQHEPKTAPNRGLTCAVWIDRIEPARGRSGLAMTSARVTFNVRIYQNFIKKPQDSIDPEVMEAADKLFEAYSGDFQLGDETRWIDLLGATQGHPMFSQSGYINIDNVVMRVMTITVPVIVENAWTQAP